MIPTLGNAKRDVVRADETLIANCTDIRDAVDICLKTAGLTQRGIAAQLHVDESYISLMFSGKRYWTEEVLAGITARTGCAAIAQYIAWRYGYLLARPDEVHDDQRQHMTAPHSKRLNEHQRAA